MPCYVYVILHIIKKTGIELTTSILSQINSGVKSCPKYVILS